MHYRLRMLLILFAAFLVVLALLWASYEGINYVRRQPPIAPIPVPMPPGV